MDRTLAAIVISGVIQLFLNLMLLAYSFGRLSQRVEVLWLAVFNHLGQDADMARQEWRQRRRERSGKAYE